MATTRPNHTVRSRSLARDRPCWFNENVDLPPGAIYARIVEKCGDRKYWESWAKDVADIFSRLVTRIGGLLADPGNETLSEWFEAFHAGLKVSINKSITTEAPST